MVSRFVFGVPIFCNILLFSLHPNFYINDADTRTAETFTDQDLNNSNPVINERHNDFMTKHVLAFVVTEDVMAYI